MKGINKSQHGHLVDALLQLERVFARIERNFEKNSGLEALIQPLKVIPTSAELKAKRVELENSYQVYLDMLDALAFHIAEYEDLFADIKVGYVGNRLKELKKIVQPQTPIAAELKESILLAYGT